MGLGLTSRPCSSSACVDAEGSGEPSARAHWTLRGVLAPEVRAVPPAGLPSSLLAFRECVMMLTKERCFELGEATMTIATRGREGGGVGIKHLRVRYGDV